MSNYQTEDCTKYDVFLLKSSVLSVNGSTNTHLRDHERKTSYLYSISWSI